MNNKQWSPLAQEFFDILKKAMTTTLILTLPDFNKHFELATDACNTGVGVVLMQGRNLVLISATIYLWEGVEECDDDCHWMEVIPNR